VRGSGLATQQKRRWQAGAQKGEEVRQCKVLRGRGRAGGQRPSRVEAARRRQGAEVVWVVRACACACYSAGRLRQQCRSADGRKVEQPAPFSMRWSR